VSRLRCDFFKTTFRAVHSVRFPMRTEPALQGISFIGGIFAQETQGERNVS
jgi:hypothetical protein